jgi:hypothetical protein
MIVADFTVRSSTGGATAWKVERFCPMGKLSCLLSPIIRIKVAKVIMFNSWFVIHNGSNLKFNSLYNPYNSSTEILISFAIDELQVFSPFLKWLCESKPVTVWWS